MGHEHKEKEQSCGYVCGILQHVLRDGCGRYSAGNVFPSILLLEQKTEGSEQKWRAGIGRPWGDEETKRDQDKVIEKEFPQR